MKEQNYISEVKVALIELAESSVKLLTWSWAYSYSESIGLKRDVCETVNMRYDKEGIEIPFPYRELVIKGGEKQENQ